MPVGVQKLAAQLEQRMPWLARERHIGALAKLLHRHRLDADAGWNAERLLHVLEIHNRTTGHSVPDPARQRNPLGYLHTLLRGAQLEPVLPRQRPALPERVAQWRLEAEAKQRELALEDPAFRAAAIARLHAEMGRGGAPASGPTRSGELARLK